jgi:hypothetical protein
MIESVWFVEMTESVLLEEEELRVGGGEVAGL